MKALKIVLTLAVVVALLAWIRRDVPFPLASMLPFCSGEPHLLYDLAGLLALILTARTIVLFQRARRPQR